MKPITSQPMNLSQRLAVRDSVTRLLEESPTLEVAARGALQTVCESLNWIWGALWVVGPRADALLCLETWYAPSSRFPEFEATCRQRAFERGVGLPGRVWADARPRWIPDVLQDPNFQRAMVAAREGLNSAFGFPILLGGDVLGVMEFFSREIQQPDADLLQMLGSVGSQIGQFLERRRAEKDRERLAREKSALLESTSEGLVKPVKQAELLEAIQEARRGAAPAVERPAAQPRSVPAGTQGLRILLAEDSQDNVLLIQSYLKASGYNADVACNGEVALQKFISGTYDIVLMDVQMPVMDGYSATRKIRQWESENRAMPVPILALTAPAPPEEVRKSLDAGCTAHLTKPIRKATLLGAIEEHAIGLVRVDSSLAGLVPGFLKSRRRDVDAIAAALEHSDYDNIRIIGHNMKGSGGGYGFNRITEIGASMEEAARRREPGEIRARTADLSGYLDRLHVEYE